MRTYGILSDGGETIYLYESWKDIDLEETELVDGDAIIRIDSYVVLTRGPGETWVRDKE